MPDDELTSLHRVAVVAIDRQGVWVAAGNSPPTAQSVTLAYFPSPLTDVAFAAAEQAFEASFAHRDEARTLARLADSAGEFDVVTLRSTAKLHAEPAFCASPVPTTEIERHRDDLALRDAALLIAISDPEFLETADLGPRVVTPGARIEQDENRDGGFASTYSCSASTEQGPRHVTLNEALSWARSRARIIHLHDAHGTCSVGIDRDPELPEWIEPDPW